MLDLKSVGWALLVVDHGSFRKAATILGVRPSVVSRSIRALEDAIGVSLFQRRSQGAQPTAAGQRILRRGRAIIDDVGDLLRTASLNGTGHEGSLCVGVVSSIAGGTARELLRSFLSAHPEVDLQVVEGSRREHIAAVRLLHMDVTFVVGTPDALDCVVEPLWSEPIMVVLPENHVLATLDSVQWDQLVGECFIVSRIDPGPEIHDYVVNHMADLGHRPMVESRRVQREGLMALVGLGRRISLVGAAEAGVVYPGVSFRPLVGEMLLFSAVWSETNDNPALRRFLSQARGLIKTLIRGQAMPLDLPP